MQVIDPAIMSDGKFSDCFHGRVASPFFSAFFYGGDEVGV